MKPLTYMQEEVMYVLRDGLLHDHKDFLNIFETGNPLESLRHCIRELRDRGYRIRTLRGRGYQLISEKGANVKVVVNGYKIPDGATPTEAKILQAIANGHHKAERITEVVWGPASQYPNFPQYLSNQRAILYTHLATLRRKGYIKHGDKQGQYFLADSNTDGQEDLEKCAS